MIYLNSLLLCIDNLSIGKAWVLKSHTITAFDSSVKEIAKMIAKRFQSWGSLDLRIQTLSGPIFETLLVVLDSYSKQSQNGEAVAQVMG